MDVSDAIATRLEIREYADDPVDGETKRSILDAGRLAPSGKNLQHWSFVLVDDDADIRRLAELSRTGGWVAGADFAVVVVTDPDYYYHAIDAGRAIEHMQFQAWEHGVGSCIYTGYDDAEMRAFLDVPADYAVTLVAGFGYPARDADRFRGEKDRAPLADVAHHGRFGTPLDFEGE